MSSKHKHPTTGTREAVAGDVDTTIANLAPKTHTHPEIAALADRVLALEKPVVVPPPVQPPVEPPPPPPPPVIIPQPSWPTSLQAAIDATPSGGTIDLTGRPEPYRELIKVTKPLTLIEPWVTGLAAATNAYAVGIEVANTVHVTILRPKVEDVRYAGIMVSDSLVVAVMGGSVKRIDALRQNASMNAYGIVATSRGIRPSEDVTFDGVEVFDVPDWHGGDTHGGKRIRFLGCGFHGTNRGVFITPSNWSSALDCEISRCVLDTPTKRSDVATTYPYNEVGITVIGGCTAHGDGNRFDGWPAGNHIDVKAGATGTFTGTVITNPKTS
jgi:hypothetical protein